MSSVSSDSIIIVFQWYCIFYVFFFPFDLFNYFYFIIFYWRVCLLLNANETKQNWPLTPGNLRYTTSVHLMVFLAIFVDSFKKPRGSKCVESSKWKSSFNCKYMWPTICLGHAELPFHSQWHFSAFTLYRSLHSHNKSVAAGIALGTRIQQWIRWMWPWPQRLYFSGDISPLPPLPLESPSPPSFQNLFSEKKLILILVLKISKVLLSSRMALANHYF